MKNRPTVFYVIGSLAMGGAERHLVTISKALASRGCKISIYCLLELGPLETMVQQAGVEVLGPPLIYKPKYFGKPIRFLMLGLSTLKLFWILLTRRPSTIHFFLPVAYVIGAIVARATWLPCLVMSRRSLNFYQQKVSLIAALEHRLHQSMAAVLGNSKRVIDNLKDEGVPRENLGLIYNGIDLAPFDQERQKVRSKNRRALGLGKDTVVLIIVANLISYKGHIDLLNALKHVHTELPPDWALLIVGRDDGIGPNLQRQAKTLEISARVHFLGLRSDVPSLLLASDIGILCSHEEGFSNALLEGMAAGLPMVATDAGGNAEAVVDGVTGYITPVKNPDRLGQAILRLATDRHLAERMGAAGRKRVEQHFSLNACVEQYEKLYCALMQGKKVSDIPGIGVVRQDMEKTT